MTPASWPRRIGALFLDWIIATLIARLILIWLPNDNEALAAFAPLVVFWAMTTLLIGTLGYSIGKRIFVLKVVNPNDQTIGLPRAAVRQFLLCLVVPAVLLTDMRRGLHDVAGGSMVASARS